MQSTLRTFVPGIRRKPVPKCKHTYVLKFMVRISPVYVQRVQGLTPMYRYPACHWQPRVRIKRTNRILFSVLRSSMPCLKRHFPSKADLPQGVTYESITGAYIRVVPTFYTRHKDITYKHTCARTYDAGAKAVMV